MENYKPIQPINIGIGKDTVNDFARKYNLEINNLYDILNRFNQRRLEFDDESRFWHQSGDMWQYTVPHDGNTVYAVYKKIDTSYQLIYPDVIVGNTTVTVENNEKFSGYILMINDDTSRGFGENAAETILKNLVQWIYGTAEDTDDIISRGPLEGQSAIEVLSEIRTLAAQVRNDSESIKEQFEEKVNEFSNELMYNSLPVGSVIPFAANVGIPEGFLLCDGSLKNKETYPELFSVIGILYGGGDDQFRLPNLVNKFVEGGSASGTYIDAGLPNITGMVGCIGIDGFIAEGAFYDAGKVGKLSNSGDDDKRVGFDASRSSSIYGKSATVQPPALVMRYIIKAFTAKGV